MNNLILSIFPGIGLLDMAFEEAGFCVVRGPDKLWGGDIKNFHPPDGVFAGVIGGPPCQCHSRLAAINRARGLKISEDLVPEYERVVLEAQPEWALMENVPDCPSPNLQFAHTERFLLNNRELGEAQNRLRMFWFGARLKYKPWVGETLAERIEAFKKPENPEWTHTVKASGSIKPSWRHKRGRIPGKIYGYCSIAQFKVACIDQGLPETFLDDAPFTVKGKFRAVGNGVPLAMGRSLALSIRDLMGDSQ